MTPMLEKIARAVAESYYAADYDAEEAKAWAAKDWEDWLPEARVALLAMREPDFAWAAEVVEPLCEPGLPYHPAPNLAFTAMIDAILKEGGE